MILEILHTTNYRYSLPVRFGEHRMMLRPRGSHDVRLLEVSLAISPTAEVRHIHDVFGNSVAVANFTDEPATELQVESRLVIDHRSGAQEQPELEVFAETYPFTYPAEEIPDLGRTIERHYRDPGHRIAMWAKRFLRDGGVTPTMELLVAMTHAIKADFTYQSREEQGTQPPDETLGARRGACRDFALLMMEGCRSLGLAARFVTGYLYDASCEGLVGGGATHAWVQVYLPGAGWVEFDPTNGIIGGRDLVRVAVTRDPRQAVPLLGSFTGPRGCCLGMRVDVTVTRHTGDAPDSGAPVTPDNPRRSAA
jgi:transglutaminase-like putative cysteine protease